MVLEFKRKNLLNTIELLVRYSPENFLSTLLKILSEVEDHVFVMQELRHIELILSDLKNVYSHEYRRISRICNGMTSGAELDDRLAAIALEGY